MSEHADLALHVVRQAASKSSWQTLAEGRARTLPRDFERDAEAEAALEQHYSALLAQARSGLLEWRERKSFSDFAFLLSEDADERLFLVGLQCVAAPLDYRALEHSFAQLSGASAHAPNAEFAQYVGVALARPVIEPPLLRALLDFCRLFRAFVSEDAPGNAPPPLRPLARAKLEAGVVAIAIAPIDAGRAGRDPLRALVEARRLLHEAHGFARDFDGALASPLEDYGAMLTLPVPVGAKSQLKGDGARRVAEKLRQLAHTRLQLATVAGAAVSVAEETREAVTQRALLALRMALESGQRVVLLEDLATASRTVRHSHVAQALDRLSSTFERQAMSEAAAMAHAFMHTVACFSGGRLDLVRLEFVLAVSQVARGIQRRYCLSADMPERWGDEAALRFDACSSLEELNDELKRTLNRLALLANNDDGPSHLRIDELLDYLRHNLSEPVKLPYLARRAGFSVPSFCRVFKRATGHSLLSYVRGLRIARAKHLLATTELPNTSVAELSGFHSQHHFIRSFKKVMQSTPGEYRRAQSTSAEGRA